MGLKSHRQTLQSCLSDADLIAAFMHAPACFCTLVCVKRLSACIQNEQTHVALNCLPQEVLADGRPLKGLPQTTLDQPIRLWHMLELIRLLQLFGERGKVSAYDRQAAWHLLDLYWQILQIVEYTRGIITV